MNWNHPEVFWLLIPLCLSLYFFAQIWNALRVTMALLIVIILADPITEWDKGQPHITVLLDHSESCRDQVQSKYYEIENLLQTNRPPQGVLETYAFARDTAKWPFDENIDLGQNETNLRSSLLHISQAHSNQGATKLLLVSDGWSTESLDILDTYLKNKDQALYWYQVNRDHGKDIAIKSFQIPEQRFQNESFLIDLEVEGDLPSTKVEVLRDHVSMGQYHVTLQSGRGTLKLKDRIPTTGSYEYEVRVIDPEDSFKGNNRMTSTIKVEGQGRVLLISSYKGDPLKKSFEKIGLEVELVDNYQTLNAGRLSGALAVIIHNVGAHDIPLDFQKALIPYVEIQGGGFAMIGGKNAFASGGYYQSILDPLLPVSMDLEEDQYKISLALGIVLDRSGSMTASTSSGRTKMQLANEGAATAVELLGQQDAITVFAVDSQAHCIVDLSRVDQGREALADRIRQIQSQGGGIFVYEGLSNAWNQLKNAPMINKHIILFSDASDSEEPGNYEDLLSEIQKAKGTVSVIGLGSRSDPDAALLEDIALKGGGRAYFCQNAVDVPAIFTQETAAVARSTFIEEPRSLAQTKNLLELGFDIPVIQHVGAFNICQTRKGASTALITHSDKQEPILSFWQKGAGKTLALTSPMAGEFADSLLTHPSYHAFHASWIQWLAKAPTPPGITIEQSRVGNEVQLSMYYDDTWQSKFAKSPPKIKAVTLAQTDSPKDLYWEQIQPGHFKTSLTLQEKKNYLGAISIGNTHLSFGPIKLGQSKEWTHNPTMLHQLTEIAKMSGGGMAPRLDKLWDFESETVKESFRPWLCALLIFMIVLEMLFYKLGWQLGYLPTFAYSISRLSAKRKGPSNLSKPNPLAKEIEIPQEEPQDLFKARLERMNKSKD